MKILFVAAQYNPFDKQMGGSNQRSHLLVEALSRFASVDVVVFHNDSISDIPNTKVIFAQELPPESHGLGNTKDRLLRLLHPLKPNSYFPVFRKKEKILDDIIAQGEYNYIVIRYLEPAIQLGLLKYSNRLVVDVDDYPVDNLIKKAKVANSTRERLHYYLMGALMSVCMRQLLKNIRSSFYPNIQQPHPVNSAYLPNIPFYQLDRVMPEAEENHRILFVGPMEYEPNCQGVLHFIRNVMPLIQKFVPDVIFRVVGAKGEADVEDILNNTPGVSRAGYVDDLVAEYENCQICIAPIYAGAGTNIKVIEALQMKRPCVVTQTASRGFEDVLADNEDYFISIDDKDFATKIVNLLNSKPLCKEVAENGNEKYKHHFSKDKFLFIVTNSLNPKNK